MKAEICYQMDGRDIAGSAEVQPLKRRGYLAPRGSFTFDAAKEIDGEASLMPYKSISQVLNAVAHAEIEEGVSPIETINGRVNDTVAALLENPNLRIIAEYVLPINQCLVSRSDADTANITTIQSKKEGLDQTRLNRQTRFPGVGEQPLKSTGDAIFNAAADPTIAAVGNLSTILEDERLKKMYEEGTLVVEQNFQDQQNNATRFTLLTASEEIPAPTGNDKTTFFMYTRNQPGQLYTALSELAERNINLSMLQFINRDENGNAMFLITIHGHLQEEIIAEGLENIAEHTRGIRLLGSYPATEYEPTNPVAEPHITQLLDTMKPEEKIPGQNQAMVILTAQDRVGVLADILKEFSDRGINLNDIGSFTTGQLDRYGFRLTFSKEASGYKQALARIVEFHAKQLLIVGEEIS